MKSILTLILVLVTAPVLANAGPSSDDRDRPANRVRERSEAGRRSRPGVIVGTKAFFERLQGKLGMSDDCEVYNDLGSGRSVARCATHRKQLNRRCNILQEGAFDANGRWFWYDDQADPPTTPPTPKKVGSSFEPATPKASVPKSRPPEAKPPVPRAYNDRTKQSR